jgi:FKBP-type peptidyl-prolyl cis-trans isomerase
MIMSAIIRNRTRWTAFAALAWILPTGAVQAQETAVTPAALQEVASHSEQRLKNKREGETFLAENKAREGIITLESGLQYKILKAGDGKKPTIDDTVVCHFRGSHIDGTEFANSYKSARPATFAVKKVIKGWSEALRLMPVGSRWQLFVPSTLAYGERGLSRRVDPDATVVLEVELIAIKDTVGAETIVRALTAIDISFKLDPRLTQGLYLGERWVSPPTYSSAGTSQSVTINARAHGRDATGKTVTIRPKWIATDPEMVTVTPDEGNAVSIMVRRVGQSSLRVTSQDVSRQLTINATSIGNVLQVQIGQ